jgi:hypothetical protein
MRMFVAVVMAVMASVRMLHVLRRCGQMVHAKNAGTDQSGQFQLKKGGCEQLPTPVIIPTSLFFAASFA